MNHVKSGARYSEYAKKPYSEAFRDFLQEPSKKNFKAFKKAESEHDGALVGFTQPESKATKMQSDEG